MRSRALTCDRGWHIPCPFLAAVLMVACCFFQSMPIGYFVIFFLSAFRPTGYLTAIFCFLSHRYWQHSGLVDTGRWLLSTIFEDSYLYFGHKLSASFVVNIHRFFILISSCSVCFYLAVLEDKKFILITSLGTSQKLPLVLSFYLKYFFPFTVKSHHLLL